jgi:hypothetical protein
MFSRGSIFSIRKLPLNVKFSVVYVILWWVKFNNLYDKAESSEFNKFDFNKRSRIIKM